jgi:hypothetical protein
MGGTFYTEVIDPNTGERTIKPRWHHGIPATFGVATTENAIATMFAAGSTYLLYKAADLNARSKFGNKTDNAKQKKLAMIAGGFAATGFATLLPWRLPSPFHGSRASQSPMQTW